MPIGDRFGRVFVEMHVMATGRNVHPRWCELNIISTSSFGFGSGESIADANG